MLKATRPSIPISNLRIMLDIDSIINLLVVAEQNWHRKDCIKWETPLTQAWQVVMIKQPSLIKDETIYFTERFTNREHRLNWRKLRLGAQLMIQHQLDGEYNGYMLDGIAVPSEVFQGRQAGCRTFAYHYLQFCLFKEMKY